jgi:hypothetical protein
LAASFVKQRRLYLIEMIKIKLFFLVLFLSLFQLSFSYAQQVNEMVYSIDNTLESQLLFENINSMEDISGEYSKNQLSIWNNQKPSTCFLSSNTKDFHFSIGRSTLLFNSVKPDHLFNFCLCKKVINIPIYLQTEKFRL